MKKRFMEEQIIDCLRVANAGLTVRIHCTSNEVTTSLRLLKLSAPEAPNHRSGVCDHFQSHLVSA
jgi:hypothetical protein